MKRAIPIFIIGILLFSCTEKEKKTELSESLSQITSLAFESISLDDMNDFERTSNNWSVVGGVYVDRSKDGEITSTEGTGVLVNIPTKPKKENLKTNFKHGDIELEVDVMMPKGSNSGLYFQERYEVQLFESWEVLDVSHGDMGGIYQRWDSTKDKGNEVYEGHAPRINAAKAPGLWQHFRIIFHAPRFDSTGYKIKDAEFKEVWLNGTLIQENVKVTGATRGGIGQDEVAKAPLMIQGDHGAVAFKNLKYKLYDNNKLSFSNMKMKEFKNEDVMLPNLDSLVPIREIVTDSISATMAVGDKVTRILDYQGKLVVPVTGDYIFDFRLNQAGGLLLIDNDTVVNRDGNFIVDSLGVSKVTLSKGVVPFRLIYNKHNPWVIGFSLSVEGPGIEKQPLHAASSIDEKKSLGSRKIMVEPTELAVTQRSFLMHGNEKRTHCISVGTPQKINYAYDLASGCLLEVWSGDFLDATQMWHSRGIRQLGEPAGFAVSFHGNLEFTMLESADSKWPKNVSEEALQFSEGYELDKVGIPIFIRKIESKIIKDKMVPSSDERKLNRTVLASGEGEIWHKVASGEAIEKLPDGSYIVNDESYFVDFSDDSLSPIIRVSDGEEELLVKIPAGEQKIEYSIIW